MRISESFALAEIILDPSLRNGNGSPLGTPGSKTPTEEKTEAQGGKGTYPGLHSTRTGCESPPTMLKTLSSGTLSYLFYSPQNLGWYILWIFVQNRKEFLLLYILPGPFKGMSEQVDKYFVKYFVVFSKV